MLGLFQVFLMSGIAISRVYCTAFEVRENTSE